MPELGLVGPAWGTDVLPCPAIDPGPGRVVTGTFKRTARELLEVKFAGDSDGSAKVETLTTTPEHPFFSVDRQEYIPAGKLREGEHVATQHGNRKIIGLLPRPGPVFVYNLEVNYAHNYHVGSSGVLVHNAYDMHHTIPLGIQKRLKKAGNSAASHPDIIGRRGLPNRRLVERTRHREIHSGRGYTGRNANGIGGGHYNNAFDRLILRNGGYKKVSTEAILEMRDFLVRWFEL